MAYMQANEKTELQITYKKNSIFPKEHTKKTFTQFVLE